MNTATSAAVLYHSRRQTWAMNYTYPILGTLLALCIGYGVTHPEQIATITAIKAGVVFVCLFVLEMVYPLQKRWGITWQYFFKRDAVLAGVNIASEAFLKYMLLILAIESAGQWHGVMSAKDLWLQVVVGLLVFEALQYGIHRGMHLNGGPIRNFLWRTHAIHHLPQQLYLVMHIVFHPVNLFIIRISVQLVPIWILGFEPLAVFIYGSIIGFHGTLSHLNFDLRLGWFNYLFVGPELHRYHHSADSHEAVNYGATLSLFDQLFGTFHYTPDRYPKELGLSQDNGYPGQTQPVKALVFPFTQAIQPLSP